MSKPTPRKGPEAHEASDDHEDRVFLRPAKPTREAQVVESPKTTDKVYARPTKSIADMTDEEV